MSRFQELIAAAQRVCESAEANLRPSVIRADIARLRRAVGNVRSRSEESVAVFGGVSVTTGAAFVELSGPALPATLPAAAATEIGLHLIQAAATAETEAALLAELRGLDLEDQQIGGLLGAMRRRRETKE